MRTCNVCTPREYESAFEYRRQFAVGLDQSWLVDLMEQAYREQGALAEIPLFVEDTGEVNWLVGDALGMDVPTPVIAQSVVQLLASRDRRGVAPRAIAAMRHGFGGHPFGANESVKLEREHGRVGDLFALTK